MTLRCAGGVAVAAQRAAAADSGMRNEWNSVNLIGKPINTRLLSLPSFLPIYLERAIIHVEQHRSVIVGRQNTVFSCEKVHQAHCAHQVKAFYYIILSFNMSRIV